MTDIGEQADTQQFHLKLRMERKRFKNVRVHFTKLPEAPGLRNGRSLSPDSKRGQTITQAQCKSWSERSKAIFVPGCRDAEQARKRRREDLGIT